MLLTPLLTCQILLQNDKINLLHYKCIVNIIVYLNPAAYPVSENLLAAPHCRKEENKNAHSTSCSPPQTHHDTNCPQLYRQAEQTKGRKIITTRITNNYDHSCQINWQSCVVRRSIVIYCIRNASLQLRITSFPSLREKNEWMDSSSFWPFFTSISIAMSIRRGREKGGTVRKSPLREKGLYRQKARNWYISGTIKTQKDNILKMSIKRLGILMTSVPSTGERRTNWNTKNH